MKLAISILSILLLAGCAQPKPPIKIAIDTYCKSAKKIPWSIYGNKKTIKAARGHNKAWDKRCSCGALKGKCRRVRK